MFYRNYLKLNKKFTFTNLDQNQCRKLLTYIFFNTCTCNCILTMTTILLTN